MIKDYVTEKIENTMEKSGKQGTVYCTFVATITYYAADNLTGYSDVLETMRLNGKLAITNVTFSRHAWSDTYVIRIVTAF